MEGHAAMATAARDRLAKLLSGGARATASSMRLSAPVSDIRVEVEGAGPVQYPVSAVQAKKLIKLAVPARFGKGEDTLTDAAIRDTWEIPRDLVRVEWDERALAGVLADVREGLGLPWNCELAIGLHSMLVYEKGQFFVTHQDTEKDDAMIGTLVVTLPSAYTGGDLLIGQGEEWTAYKGSKTAHTIVAFYADRQHEVLPVKAGYRVTLTYNLLLRGDTSGQQGITGDDATIAELARCLTEHFSTEAERSWGGSLGHPPARLVYMLDHEYTPRGLSWSRLKGADARRGGLLRAAAGQAGCEVVLGLADVRETHEAIPAGEYYGRGRYRERDDEDDYGSGDGKYEVQDLLSSEVELTRWLAPDGKRSEEVSLSIGDHEVCASTPSGDLKPYSQEYEGYMGNYGSTLDRWYKRGALVVWPSEQAFANRAETSPAWAMDELASRAGSGDLDGARAVAGTLSRFWEQGARAQEKAQAGQPELFPKALRAAIALQDAETARALLRPFHVESLRPADATALAELAAGYGADWTRALLDAWFGDSRSWSYADGREEWLAMLPALCAALDEAGAAIAASQVLHRTWEWLRLTASDRIEPGRLSQQREGPLTSLGAPLAAILAAAALLGPDAASLAEEITDFARQQPHGVIPLLLATLRAAAVLPADVRKDGGFADIAAGCAARLRVLQGRPPRASDDWSIQLPPGSCTCELCATLKEFLASRTRRTFEWPLAKDKRHHVHSRIDAAELPVTHVTRRRGSPFTLVLAKTDRLFTGEAQTLARDAADLAWLGQEWGVPANQGFGTTVAREP
jgi:hypothetical protein